MSVMVQALQRLQTNPKSGKRKLSYHDENRADQACKMLRSMSIREPLATIDDTSTEENDNELSI